MLSRRELGAFGRDGYVVLRGAVPRPVVWDCRRTIRRRLAAEGIDVSDRATWSRPSVTLPWPATTAFTRAATSPALTEAYDQLIGPGTWTHAPAIGGALLVRLPVPRKRVATAWHIDGSAVRDGRIVTSLASPTRGVLCLVLFSDVGPDDAPTELKVGSHLDVAPLLAGAGDRGADVFAVTSSLRPSTLDQPSVFATGQAGDVYLCHPFLLHRATRPHRSGHPRLMAQPGMLTHRPFALEGGRPRAVERAIRAAVEAAPRRRRLKRPDASGRPTRPIRSEELVGRERPRRR